MRHLHGNPNHLHMIKISLVAAHHAKWAFSVTSQPEKSNWAAIVCEIRESKHNGGNTHTVHSHLKKEKCLCEAFITYETSALLDYRTVSGSLVCTIKYTVFSLWYFVIGFKPQKAKMSLQSIIKKRAYVFSCIL